MEGTHSRNNLEASDTRAGCYSRLVVGRYRKIFDRVSSCLYWHLLLFSSFSQMKYGHSTLTYVSIASSYS